MTYYTNIVIYYGSTLVTIGIFSYLILAIYMIRSTIKVPAGPYTWISNLCSFTLFILITVCLIISLVSASTRDLEEDETAVEDTLDLDLKFELSSEMSDFISKNAMYPLLVVEVVIFVYLNSRLLWIWYSAGEFNTIVNKLIFILRFLGIINELGCVVDFGIRLYGPKPVPFMSTENYCACWIAF